MKKNSINILLVDDETKITQKVSKILKNEGYEVDSVDNGKKAFELLKENTYHILVTDLSMPEISGFEVMEHVKKNHPELLMLVLTGYASIEGIIKAIKLGVYDFIQKPIDAETLKLSIKRAAERTKLELENLENIKELNKLNSLKNEFLSVVSHDLRSPLSSIGGYVNYLLKKGDLNDLQHRYMLIIKDISEYMYTMVGELLDISKIETGNISIEKEMIDLEELINTSINNFILLGIDKNNIIEFYNKASDSYLNVDKMKLLQVLNNLINNAIKFTENGKIIITLSEDSKKDIIITVEDTGTGIKSSILKDLFNQYKIYHAKGTRGETGNGLGLVICKKFLELHKGEISVKSKAGKGSTFIIKLPRI